MAVKINEVMRIKREAMLLTQAQFAAKVGCTGGTISSFENGKDVGEAIVKCIKYTIKDLESKLTKKNLDLTNSAVQLKWQLRNLTTS